MCLYTIISGDKGNLQGVNDNNCERRKTITKSMATLSSYICMYVRSGPGGPVNAQRANVWPAG